MPVTTYFIETPCKLIQHGDGSQFQNFRKVLLETPCIKECWKTAFKKSKLKGKPRIGIKTNLVFNFQRNTKFALCIRQTIITCVIFERGLVNESSLNLSPDTLLPIDLDKSFAL